MKKTKYSVQMSNKIYLVVNTINIITITYKFETNIYKRKTKSLSMQLYVIYYIHVVTISK